MTCLSNLTIYTRRLKKPDGIVWHCVVTHDIKFESSDKSLHQEK